MPVPAVQDGTDIRGAEVDIDSTTKEPAEEPAPIRAEPHRDPSDAVGNIEMTPPGSVWLVLSRYLVSVKIGVVICGILIISGVLYWVVRPDWRKQTSGTDVALSDVAFPTPQSGWAVGEKGVILQTEDSGRAWAKQNSSSSENLESVAFASPQVGWAVSDSDSILRTTDSGQTWVKQVSPAIEGPTSVSFATSESGWVVGHNRRGISCILQTVASRGRGKRAELMVSLSRSLQLQHSRLGRWGL